MRRTNLAVDIGDLYNVHGRKLFARIAIDDARFVVRHDVTVPLLWRTDLGGALSSCVRPPFGLLTPPGRWGMDHVNHAAARSENADCSIRDNLRLLARRRHRRGARRGRDDHVGGPNVRGTW
jgi:hypothetical protein